MGRKNLGIFNYIWGINETIQFISGDTGRIAWIQERENLGHP